MTDTAAATATPGTAATPPAAPAAGGSAAGRLGWLDALRGFAALVVAWFHAAPYLIGPDLPATLFRHFDTGKYGVLLFFLVSGYVIPMSLERHGSLRRFWTGRIFRIYPAYLLSLAVMGALTAAGFLVMPESLQDETVTGILGHATMLQEFLGLRGAVRVYWTLSFEMAFYLIVAGLFAWRLHRLSAAWAAGLAVTAIAGGSLLPDDLFAATFADRRLTAAVLLVLVAGSVVAYLAGRPSAVAVAGLIGIAFVLLPALNGSPTRWNTAISSWQSLLMLAVMFAGTVIYRAQHGQTGRWTAAATLTVVTAAVATGNWIHNGSTDQRDIWIATTAAVVVTFAAAYALRHRAMPAVLTWLGAISYSVYLLHPILLSCLYRIVPRAHERPLPVNLAVVALYFAATLLAAWVAYRLVEMPGQRLGHRTQRLLDHRLGPDTLAPGAITTQRVAAGTGHARNPRRSV
jgi:peptidoglycan/LPS O-acetylase OafA/YrhL